MSLINEALKKAQRARSDDAAGTLPPMPGSGGRVAKRSEPRTAQQLVLIGAGAIVLVVLSVVATVYLVNRPPEPKPIAQAKPAAPPTTATSPANSAPIVTAPIIVAPIPSTKTSPETTAPGPQPAPGASNVERTAVAPTTPVEATAPASVAQSSPSATTPTSDPKLVPALPAPGGATSVQVAAVSPAPPPNVSSAPASASALPAAAPAPKPEERVGLFVDAIRVAGIRSSGNESRVLMNDRVFRVNDIVERNYGLRLTKVDTNALTFTDANGAVYVKNF